MRNHGEGVTSLNLCQSQSHLISESGRFLTNQSQYRFGIAWTLNKDQKHILSKLSKYSKPVKCFKRSVFLFFLLNERHSSLFFHVLLLLLFLQLLHATPISLCCFSFFIHSFGRHYTKLSKRKTYFPSHSLASSLLNQLFGKTKWHWKLDVQSRSKLAVVYV